MSKPSTQKVAVAVLCSEPFFLSSPPPAKLHGMVTEACTQAALDTEALVVTVKSAVEESVQQCEAQILEQTNLCQETKQVLHKALVGESNPFGAWWAAKSN